MTAGAEDARRVREILAAHPLAPLVLRAAAEAGPPGAWVGAGLVRNAVWDALHGLPPSSPADVDVAHFDAADPTPEADRRWEERLRGRWPDVPWQVRNQARMHARNGHPPYADALDGIAHWVETATAVAARWTPDGIEVAAPHGLGDLLGLALRPVPGPHARPEVFLERVRTKDWLRRWPRLRVAGP